MLKNSKQMLIILTATVVLTAWFSLTLIAYPSGSPAGYTGSPGDGQHCVSCHGGSAATVSGWIISNIPAQGYTPGSVYDITVTATGTGKKGFELSPQNILGTQLGVLAAGTGSHLVGGTKYVTQNSSGSTSTPVSWTFTWTAPVAGTGNVTFYGAFTVGKTVTKLSTLEVTENAAAPLSANATATPSVVCSGQPVQLNVMPSGGSGNYTFSWSSIPPGFTSSMQNPVVTPGTSTQYIAHVEDGAGFIDAPADVAVVQPATVSAGSDTTCGLLVTQIPLQGSATGFTSVQWSTSGSGTFSNAGSLATTYYPSGADISSGMSTLTLTATPQAPCTTPATAARIIHFGWPTGGIDGVWDGISMVISPNPTRGKFTLAINRPENTEAVVTVYNTYGQVILTRTMNGSYGNVESFDLSGFPAGGYLVKVTTPRHTTSRKLVLE
jgi:hypothetical protein